MEYTLDWNYVDISMPRYVQEWLKHLLYKQQIHTQFSPHEHAPINWTNKAELLYAQKPDDATIFRKEDTKYM